MDVALSSGRTQRSPLSCDRAVKDGVAVRSEPFVCNDGTGTASLSDVGRLSNREPPCRVPIPVLSDLDYVSVSSFREHEPSALHIHPNEYEFICCRRGRNLVFVRGPSRYFVHPGEVAISRPGEPHSLQILNPKGYSAIVLRIRKPPRGKKVAGLSSGETDWLFRSIDEIPNSTFPFNGYVVQLLHRISRIARCPEGPDPIGRNLPLRTIILQLLMELIDCGRRRSAAGVGKNTLSDIISEMNAHPERNYPVDELVRRTPWSRMKFIATFRSLTGLPPHAYLLSLRIEKAKQLLAEGNLSVEAVAHRLGYASASHFISHFKMTTGRTPRGCAAKSIKKI